jgi:hypothetical protein
LVEHNLAKVGVASSSLVSRSRLKKTPEYRGFRFYEVKALNFYTWPVVTVPTEGKYISVGAYLFTGILTYGRVAGVSRNEKMTLNVPLGEVRMTEPGRPWLAQPEIFAEVYYWPMAGWQSGYAAACKAVYAGSIPTPASNLRGKMFKVESEK